MTPSVDRRMPLSRRQAGRLLVAAAVAVTALITLPTAATAEAVPSASTDLCVGVQCDTPESGSFVPEAAAAASVASLEELKAQSTSGFYELPALVYRGDTQPRSVVYYAKAGELDLMPASVRNLTVVQDFARNGFNFAADGLIVIDHGMAMPVPGARAAAAKRPKAKAATINDCPDRYFCIFADEYWPYLSYAYSGPVYTGTGWHNFGTNIGKSMGNFRDGDSLLADHGMGTGTQYCARERSSDASLANNAIGNGNASSWAMLRGADDRC
ncbi:hypothetical protein [Conexibacter woesei]|uniref:Uncharacterized protein n=1 Tax=Conexibacter woesei (strain DSM 14684 / CCUG 47730 / CIP 108061 / JCM 11494 / NBRC 100937 / ID131577) TaxID=469383 RepID=D3F6V4_CONWI|nr:hypothetical protein [Conexibacter woesei]ADB52752.1 hypothetical protein Cwoe_4338 [Conexibacter woesei DSM 14684]